MIFITGGCRSGKSTFAIKLAESLKGKKAYLATGEPLDDEMLERIENHKKKRGRSWTTIEEPINVIEVIKENKEFDAMLLDCLTLWISNLLCKDASVKKYIDRFVSACKKSKANIIIVSNEVGMGIVPDNPLAREFRDITGYANQKLLEASDETYFVVSGMPMRLK